MAKLLESGVPANIQAEKMILGGILLENDTYFDDLGDLTASDFSLDSHQLIFECMGSILSGYESGMYHVDLVTLANALASRESMGQKHIDIIGGVAYLSSLTEGLPRRPVVEEYVRIVREKAKMRVLMALGNSLQAAAQDSSEHSGFLLDWMQERLTAVVADEQMEAVKVGDVCGVVEQGILKKRDAPMEQVALDLTWGLNELDKFTKGLFGGEFTILSAESGGGKTSLMWQIVVANAMAGVPCAVFSMEMSKEKLIQRLYPLLSQVVTANHIRDPRLMNLHTHVPEMQRLSEMMAKLPIWIDDTSPLSLAKFKARAKKLRRKHGCRVIAADYLQLFEAPGKTGVEKIETISFGLRDFAKAEQDMALIVLSQYSKAQGFVKKNRRTKSDLMGGSAIHHAAQNVVLVTIESPEKRDKKDLLDVEIVVDKQRDGATGRVTCCYDRDSLKFVSKPQGDMRFHEQPSTDARKD